MNLYLCIWRRNSFLLYLFFLIETLTGTIIRKQNGGDKVGMINQEVVYRSEFSDVFYVKDKNVVFVHWKKYCEFEQYRTPLEHALNVIKDHDCCNYVADTRDGFEDNPLDTKWVAEYFMPKAKEYGCRIVYFIIDENNSLREELEGQEKDSAQLLEFRYIYGLDEV